MARIILSARQKATLRSASREAVRETFTSLGNFRQRNNWIGESNRYGKDCPAVLKRDLKANRPLNHLHMRQYVAASGPLHCSDGWGFLGRAANAHISGDPDAARHLAYYAELRGAMALLACEGIGSINTVHYVIDHRLRCRKLDRGGTHIATWLALEHWSDLARAADLLSEIIAPGGIRMSDWLTAFRTPYSARAITGNWLRSWGLDIKRLTQDREARNESSYRPTRIRSRTVMSARSAARSLIGLWTAIEPQSHARFEQLDRSLLALSMKQAYEATTGQAATANLTDFTARLTAAVQNLSPRLAGPPRSTQHLRLGLVR